MSITIGARTWLERLWSGIADRGERYASVPAASTPPLQRAQMLASALLSERGEASGAAVARELLSVVRDLAPADASAFRLFLAGNFAPDPEALRHAAEAYLQDPSPERALTVFEEAEPPRQELLRRMNMAPGGTAALVRMRRDLLEELNAEPALRTLDGDLRHLFTSWFNRGFLELRRIDWDTPAAILEKLIAYEAVHEIQGWDDLRRRLAPDRRCFGFFHRALPGEPLIFVEVALVKGLAEAVQPLLALPEERDPAPVPGFDTAIFYSISNCQEGLRGVSFGNFLIKQVVEELKSELPQLTTFSTLSPVPGFRRWLGKALEQETAAGAVTLLRPAEIEALAALAPDAPADRPAALVEAVTKGQWWTEEAKAEALRGPLLRLCAQYLTRPNGRDARIDPVARFHLGNGARLERVNWPGNTSARGMKESYGVMVNYLYDPESIEANHEAFVHSGAIVRSPAVDGMLALPRLAGVEPAKPARGMLPRLRGGSGEARKAG
ncbi:malonyl-CoA decarboxylase [Roseomonas sp. NAR14]|uniref:Malonyl-CoA decarboxylase n=1 Tax=Roseomonas acroporae TaxID=2937791 RepID=A0A9X2BWG9_9PROT|nr:malonyl-CoA decarboxylase [Roseomonas acroporae]MCK8783870.1 malonyl-CoA decarboxylase [Roseomonas acroporae]